jgi:hypothetical protein
MPVKKGKDCYGDVLGEFKRGTLHSGKKGGVVKSKDQALAIARSMCGYGECDCDGTQCTKCKKKTAMMAIGYSESTAEFIVSQAFK